MKTINIDDNIFSFDYEIVKTNYFNGSKNETLYKAIKNIKKDDNIANEEDIKNLINYIRNSKEHELNKDIITENQHYTKSAYQNNFDSFICFAKNTKTQKHQIIFSEDISTTINSKNIFVSKNTFDLIYKNNFIYLEDGLVTILEKFFENYISNNIENNLKNKQIISFFLVPYLVSRKEKYNNFIIHCFLNNNDNYTIEKFLSNQNVIDNIIILDKKNPNFSLYCNFIEEFKISLLYENLDWEECNLIPISPDKALLLCNNQPFEYIKKYGLKEADYIINSLINFIGYISRYDLEEEDYQTKNEFIYINSKGQRYQLNKSFLIWINNKELIPFCKELKKIKSQKKLEKFSDKLIDYWRHIKNEEIKNNNPKVKYMIQEQYNNIINTFKNK